jgi:hypothetical protein
LTPTGANGDTLGNDNSLYSTSTPSFLSGGVTPPSPAPISVEVTAEPAAPAVASPLSSEALATYVTQSAARDDKTALVSPDRPVTAVGGVRPRSPRVGMSREASSLSRQSTQQSSGTPQSELLTEPQTETEQGREVVENPPCEVKREPSTLSRQSLAAFVKQQELEESRPMSRETAVSRDSGISREASSLSKQSIAAFVAQQEEEILESRPTSREFAKLTHRGSIEEYISQQAAQVHGIPSVHSA